MLRGIDTASAGMVADESWQQILANDLAQIGTPGYKSETPVIGSFETLLVARTGAGGGVVGSQSGGAAVVAAITDWTEGALQVTGNPLDVALQGSGFFAVQTPQGVRYTRAGDFSLDASGDLVTPQGYLVLSTAGTPLKAGENAQIAPDGTLGSSTGASGRIGVYNPALASLTDTGGGIYQTNGPAPLLAGAALTPGALESSNVQAPEVLAAMIQVLRHFQAGQQFVTEDKSTIDRFIQEAG